MLKMGAGTGKLYIEVTGAVSAVSAPSNGICAFNRICALNRINALCAFDDIRWLSGQYLAVHFRDILVDLPTRMAWGSDGGRRF